MNNSHNNQRTQAMKVTTHHKTCGCATSKIEDGRSSRYRLQPGIFDGCHVQVEGSCYKCRNKQVDARLSELNLEQAKELLEQVRTRINLAPFLGIR